MTTNQNNLEEKPMTFIDHLRDLRDCLVRAAISIVVGMCLAFGFSEHIFDIIRKPIVPYLQGGGLVFTSPIDKFMAHLQISLVMGVILSAPFWLYQIWKFISPALYKNEKKVAAGFVITGTIQFLLGAAFCYYIVFPGAFEFLMKFGGTTDKPMITISQYLDFFTHTIIIFGLTFEVPVIIVFLGMIGLISQRFLKEKRRYSILVNAIIAGVVTPPDLLSMLFLLVPLMVMYEISIILVGVFERRKAAAANNFS